MQARLFAALIVSAGTAMPAAAQSLNAYPPSWFVYAVTPFCQAWQNGVQACFPVALVGPAPTALPAGLQPLMPTPPAPPAHPMAAPAWPMAAPAWPMAAPGPAWPSAPSPAVPAATAPTARAATAAAPAAPPSVPIDAVPPVASALPSPPAASPAALPPVAGPLSGAPVAPSTGREPAVVLFAFDSAELTADAQDQLAAWLAGGPRDVPIKLTGHADRLGPATYNQALSLQRARSVLHYLTGKGARPNDIRVAGRGEYAPVVRCAGGPTPETKDCLAPNRRVEISLR